MDRASLPKAGRRHCARPDKLCQAKRLIASVKQNVLRDMLDVLAVVTRDTAAVTPERAQAVHTLERGLTFLQPEAE